MVLRPSRVSVVNPGNSCIGAYYRDALNTINSNPLHVPGVFYTIYPYNGLSRIPIAPKYFDPIDPHRLTTADLFTSSTSCPVSVLPGYPNQCFPDEQRKGKKIGAFDSEISVYPNPTNNLITVDGLEINELVRVNNSMGETVKLFNVKNNKVELNIMDFPAGIYLIVPQNSKPIKFVKQ